MRRAVTCPCSNGQPSGMRLMSRSISLLRERDGHYTRGRGARDTFATRGHAWSLLCPDLGELDFQYGRLADNRVLADLHDAQFAREDQSAGQHDVRFLAVDRDGALPAWLLIAGRQEPQ